MNPFVTFLIVVPFVLSGFLLLGSVWSLVMRGPHWDILFANVLFGGISVGLIYLLIRMSRSAVLDEKELERISHAEKRTLTNITLLVTYIVLFIGLAITMSLAVLRHWLGVVAIVMALSMIVSGLWERKRHQIIQDSDTKPPDVNESRELLFTAYRRTKNWVLITSGLMIVSTSFLFLYFDGNRLISNLDFIAFVCLIGSVVFWFCSKETHFD